MRINYYISIFLLEYSASYTLCNDTSIFCVSVHMNPVTTHEFSEDFAEEGGEYLDSVGW